MRRSRSLLALAALLALAGALLSGLLFLGHLRGLEGWLAGVCGEVGSACARVLRSRWSVLPPAPPGPEGEVPASGIPVAALGLYYFTGLTLWLLLVGLPGERRRGLHEALLYVVAGGCLLSLAFVAILVTQVRTLCPLCLAAHACNFALLGVLWVLRPSGGVAPSGIAPEHPSGRLVAATLALVAATCAALWFAGRNAALGFENAVFAARFEELDRDASLLEVRFLADTRFSADEAAKARFDEVLRPDDAQIEPGEGLHSTLVVFTDLECPNCLRFARFLHETILPLYAGHLRVVYKHYPLDDHPQAEVAARALEAARRQESFWELHERLLDLWDRLGEVDYAALSGELGLDVARFRADLESDEVRERVFADKLLGRGLGVEGTPTVFLDRHEVDRFVRTVRGFWKLRADALRRAREGRGQPW